MTFQRKTNENGNALFLILIAVALFAALSYAVTQSGRGGGSIDNEKALILASQTTQYPASIRTAVTRMVITGTSVGTLDFATTGLGNTSDEVFSANGGGVAIQPPPANSTVDPAEVWQFLDALHATTGWYIENVGTNTSTSGRDIVAVLEGVTSGVCSQINRGLGITDAVQSNAAVTFTGDGALAYTAGGSANTFGLMYPVGDEVAQPFACYENGASSGNFVYYHGLVEQ